MSIAYLVSRYPAPSHTFIRREIAALRRRGLEIETCSVHPGESLSQEDRDEAGRTFYVFPAPPAAFARALLSTFARRPLAFLRTLAATLGHRLRGPKGWLKALAYFVEGMRLAQELERRRVTHLHNHFANAAANVGLSASRYLGIGWSVSLHGFSDFDGAMTSLLPEKVEASRFAAVVTRAGIEEVRRRVDRRHWHKLHLVRCGIEVERLPPPVPRPGNRAERLSILTVGRLSPEKAQVGLVSAFAEALRAGIDAELVIVGGGPEEPHIRAAVAAHGVADRVQLRGRQPEAEVFRAMASADLFVLSSLHEGLPVVLMEALALELPVVAPAVGGIPELVVHDQTGLLFAAGDWPGLARRMVDLASDPGLRSRLAAAGRRRVLDEFDVERAVDPLARLFQECERARDQARG